MTFDDVTRPELSKCIRIISEFNVLLIHVRARAVACYHQNCVMSAAHTAYYMDKNGCISKGSVSLSIIVSSSKYTVKTKKIALLP